MLSAVKLTMLNSMAGSDFVQSLEQQRDWGITALDLKDAIYGKNVVELSEEEAEQAKVEIDSRDMFVYCMSTSLYDDDLEKGERHFYTHHMALLDQTIRVATVLQPRVIRLIAAKTSKWHPGLNSIAYINEHHSWLWDMYREAIDRIDEAGFQVTIENESPNCILSTPGQVNAFFAQLDRRGKVFFTYDVQNLWRMGTYPSVEAYESMKGLIGYLHLKGGQAIASGQPLEWRSSLEDATWPVAKITQYAVNDGVSPVICLNPSSGKKPEGYIDELVYKQDLAFIRKHITGVE